MFTLGIVLGTCNAQIICLYFAREVVSAFWMWGVCTWCIPCSWKLFSLQETENSIPCKLKLSLVVQKCVPPFILKCVHRVGNPMCLWALPALYAGFCRKQSASLPQLWTSPEENSKAGCKTSWLCRSSVSPRQGGRASQRFCIGNLATFFYSSCKKTAAVVTCHLKVVVG